MTGFSNLLKILTITLFFSLNFTTTTLANSNINEDAELEYVLNQNGNIDLTYAIDLAVPKNYTTAISHYNIDFPFEEISFSTVRSERETLDFNAKTEGNSTILSINLEERILNHSNPISIKIEAKIKDRLLKETSINKMLSLPAEISNIKITNVSLKYPRDFGEPHSTITTWEIETSPDYISLTTNRVPKNINILWGEIPTYSFELRKKLFNSPSEPMKSFDVTIPKAVYNQKIIISEISPLPSFAYQDAEGNIFLTYHIQPNTEISVEIKGQIQLMLNRDSDEITTFEKSILTKQEGYWKLTDEYELNRFKVGLKQAGVESTNINQMSEEESKIFYKFAYDYVVNRLNIQNLKVNSMESNIRQGADNTLEQREYSAPEDSVDLLTAIYRAYGVPTRMIEGYIVQNAGFHHSWLQYWNKETGWNTVDPALENYTNVDYFNANLHSHITILTRSYNYLNPKVTFLAGEDFEVDLGKSRIDENLAVENDITLNPIKKTTKETTGILDIKNTGNTIISLSRFANQENIKFGVYNNLQLIVPNQTVSIPFTYDTSNRTGKEIWIKYTSINDEESLNSLRVQEVESTFWWWNYLVIIGTFIVIWIIIYVCYLILKKILKWKENYYQ